MSHIYCLGNPIPEIPDLSNFKIPFGLAFPGLPTLPSPIFPTLVIPSLEKYIAGVELQISQLIVSVKSMIDPLLGYLNIPLDAWLPKIPGMPNFSLVDIINGRTDKIIAEIRRLVALNFDFNRYFSIPLLPRIPTLYPTMEIPDIKVIQTFQFMMRNYMALIVTRVTNLIAQVTDRLEIGMPVFPTIPSSDQIFQMLKATLEEAVGGLDLSIFAKSFNIDVNALMARARELNVDVNQLIMEKIGPIKDIDDFVIYVKNFKLDVNSILSKIIFPMLPALPKVPNIPTDIMIPEVQIVAELSNFVMNLVYGLMKKIKDFIDGTLGNFISFAFPTICI